MTEEKEFNLTHENEKKKEYLKSYKSKCKKLESLEEQLLSIREVEKSAKTQSISDMPKSSKKTDLSDLMVMIEIIYTKIVNLRAECLSRKLDIESRIADLSDGTESLILHKRYIEIKEWEQICVDIGYSWKHTHRLHSNALRNFKLVNKHDIE